ncbi:MAG: amidohydrolase family protein [Candidatus Rokubacteria bacterium]|nr:amidohydrolase family protein [Candidatus Rokubacteria bacterium]
MAPVIDVHTHNYTEGWLALIRARGGPDYEIRESVDSPMTLFRRGASFGPLEPAHFDFDLRVKAMKAAGVDLAIITLSAPSAFWGDAATSAEAARIANDEFCAAATAHPDHIRWMATLPWEYPAAAVAELERAVKLGARGVLVLGNINGRHLTDPLFAPVWRAIDARALPVLLHPTVPAGAEALDLAQYALVGSIGFMVDTSVAVVRMIFDGFFDRYPNLKLIASHAGATLPYISGRLDRVFATAKRARAAIARPPSEYLRHIYYDSVCYRQDALQMCVDVGGASQVFYGSDYPFNFGDMVGCLARVNALAAPVRDSVRGANALRAFGL